MLMIQSSTNGINEYVDKVHSQIVHKKSISLKYKTTEERTVLKVITILERELNTSHELKCTKVLERKRFFPVFFFFTK